jgi:hypothetical protein
MLDRIDCLTFMTVLVAGRQTDQFEDAVKLAYHSGASQEDLLTAAEIGRVLANVPDPVVVQAYSTIHAWHWIMPGGLGHKPELAAQAA